MARATPDWIDTDLADRRVALPLSAADAPWLALALLPGVLAVGVYLATNPYPAYGAGLYSAIAEAIAANGYAPPERIDGYTADGVPFAYPPLQFYLLAVLFDLGAGPAAVARFLPGIGVLAGLVPAYLLGRDYVGSRPAGAAAATLIAVNPQMLQWHVSAGGVVRAFAFLYALTAIYAGYHVFASGSRRAVVAGAVAVGLVGLTHPTYSLFTVVSYVLFWLFLDRSPAGFLRGLAVGLGGLLVASPWLAWAVTTHGPEVFTAAAGTHGGIGGGATDVLGALTGYQLVPLLAAAYLLLRGDRLLPAWVAAAALLFDQPRFVYAVGAFAVAAAAADAVRRFRVRKRLTAGGIDRGGALAAALLVAATLGGGLYLSHEMTLAADPSTPEFLDDEAVAAMEWAAAETDPDATFVVLGDAAEWFPALSERTILVGPWGVEWEDADAYDRHLEAFETASGCHSVDCVESATAAAAGSPDYVYVPKGSYTVRGHPAVGFGTLERSFGASDEWELAYENEGVAVFQRTA